jgi:thioesterase domain-containing protein
MKALPKTPNGKLDRKRLPALTEISDDSRKGFVAPRDSLELKLVKIWEKVMQLESIGVRDNFFEIGGHSLLAVRLMNEMRPLIDADYTISTLFRQSTIEDLANLIRQPNQPVSYSPLIPIQEKGTAIPFFCVHPGGGSVFCYVDLAREIGSHQPFYGLQASGLDRGQKPCTSIEEMARKYLEAVLTVQPEGPYYLGGWSMGGLIEYEMARQLNEAGQKTGLVAMIDTWAPIAGDYISQLEKGEPELLISFALNLGISANDISDLINSAEMNREQSLSIFLEMALKVGAVPSGAGLEHLKRLYDVYKSNALAIISYAHNGRRDEIPVTLFEASEKLRKTQTITEDSPSAGWRVWSPGALEVHEVPGNHFNVVHQPNVKTLASELRECLLRAQAM